MAMMFDATLKDLARECPLGMLAEFDEPQSAPVRSLNILDTPSALCPGARSTWALHGRDRRPACGSTSTIEAPRRIAYHHRRTRRPRMARSRPT